MDIFRLTGVVDLKIDEFKAKAKKFETNIKRLEDKILELRKAKLVDGATSAQIEEYNKDIRKTSVELKEQRLEYGRLRTEVGRYVTSTKEATKAQTQFRSQVGATNSVALEFNRIIQDAPFGIIGIGNNLQQLATTFSQVRASAGSTGQALSQVFTSIVSPANLALIAVSAITSAWTAYQLGVFDSKEETQELKTAQEQLAESLKRTLDALNAVNSARISGSKNAQSELTQLELLTSVVNDSNKSQAERVKAFSILQELYPRILGNMSAEEALAGGIASQYSLIASAILERASAVAVEEKLVELAKTRIDLLEQERQQTNFQIEAENRRNALTIEQAELQKKIASSKVFTGEEYGGLLNRLAEVKRELQTLNADFETFSLVAGTTTGELQKNSAEADRLKEQYKSLSLSLIGLLDPLEEAPEKIDKATKALEKQREELAKYLDLIAIVDGLDLKGVNFTGEDIKFKETDIPLPDPALFEERVTQLDDQVGRMLAIFAKIKDIGAQEALGGNPFSFLVDSIFALKQINEELGNSELTIDQTAEKIREKTLLLGDIFSALGDTIANTFFRGNRAMGRFVSALGDFVGQSIIIAKTLSKSNNVVANSGAVASASQASASMGPAGFFTLAPFIASALALVSSAFSAFGGEKSGGGGFAGASASASTNAMGRVFSAGGLGFAGFGNFELESRISGTDIKLVLTRTETANA